MMNNKNKVLTILVGTPASGKSTYAQQAYDNTKAQGKEGLYIVSSDAIRYNLFGDLRNKDIYTKEHHTQVFQAVTNRIRYLMTTQTIHSNIEIIVDATNLSRKGRKNYYGIAKKYGYHTQIVYFLEPLATLLDRNSKRANVVPKGNIKAMYISQVPPKVGIDCDDFKVVTTTPFFTKTEVGDNNNPDAIQKLLSDGLYHVTKEWHDELKGILEPHDNPHHLESIIDHIKMCIKKVIDNVDSWEGLDDFWGYGNGFIMYTIALYHDLGKAVTKTFDEQGVAHFYSHENVSANYFLLALQSNSYLKSMIDKQVVLDSILHHMQVHAENGISPKTIKNNEISIKTQDTLFHFEEVDSSCRITK